jgi:hypothetical protein
MKKALAEVSNEQLTNELETRLAAIEKRLEKLDPQPPLADREPYHVGSEIFGVTDAECTVPLRVCGYLEGRVLVAVPGEPGLRPLPLGSVKPLANHTRGKLPSPMDLDPKARAFMAGRDAARLAAQTQPKPNLPAAELEYQRGRR